MRSGKNARNTLLVGWHAVIVVLGGGAAATLLTSAAIGLITAPISAARASEAGVSDQMSGTRNL